MALWSIADSNLCSLGDKTVRSRGRGIGCENRRIVVKFDWRNGNAAAEISERWGDSKPSRFRGFVRSSDMIFYHLMNWDQFVFAPSQLETTLQWNVVSNWLSSCTKVQFVKKLKLLTSGAHDHLGMGSANERRRYIVTSSFIGWVHSQNDFCVRCLEMGQVAHYWDDCHDTLYLIVMQLHSFEDQAPWIHLHSCIHRRCHIHTWCSNEWTALTWLKDRVPV